MISFIVPAHDEAQLIAATLAALHGAAQALQLDYEVVVVDDASGDGTAAIAARAGARVVRIESRHIAAARNAGAAAADGKTLFFVDADTLVDAAVIGAALAAMRTGTVGGGARVCLPEGAGGWSHLSAACLVWLLRLAGIAPGCFVYCSRAAFEAVGGFDQRYYAGEDVAISRALGGLGRFVILRETVRTSDRKLHTFRAAEHLRLMLRFALRGRRMLRSRDDLALWYERRHDHR